MIKVGLNKVLVEEVKDKGNSGTIELPDNLKRKLYKVIAMGRPRTTFDNAPDVNAKDFVLLTPNAGYPVKTDDKEYLVVSYDDILVVNV